MDLSKIELLSNDSGAPIAYCTVDNTSFYADNLKELNEKVEEHNYTCVMEIIRDNREFTYGFGIRVS
jgi:hypothetical protein